MLILSSVFQVFYQVLKKEVIRKEYSGNIPEDRGEDSPTIWTDKKAIKGLFHGGRTADPRYFYRKSGELHPSKKANGQIDDVAFTKALIYIGIKPSPAEINWSNRDAAYQAKVLFEQFLLKYKDTLKLETEKSITQKKSLKDLAPAIIDEFSAQYPESLNSNFTAVKLLVQRFYESIATSNLKDAWELMSPDFQSGRPWNGDFEKFRAGYINTNGLRNIVVFNITQSVPNVIDTRVFYDDEIAAFTTKELSSLDSMTVGELDIFCENIKKMKNDFEKQGLKGFDKIEIHKLFDASASEYIWYKCNYDPSRLDELFTTQKAIIVKRVYDCSCRFYNDKWLINKINAMKTFSAR